MASVQASNPTPRIMRRTQAERRSESERRMIEAAIAIIVEDGVAAVTFESIGQRAGYSRGLAGARFGSKQGLIEAVVGYLSERSDISFATDGNAGGPVLDTILAYVDSALTARSSHESQAYYRLLSSTLADTSGLKPVFAREHERRLDWLRRQIARGQEAGEVRRDIDAAIGATLIGTIVVGFGVQGLVDEALNIPATRRSVREALLRSFAAVPR